MTQTNQSLTSNCIGSRKGELARRRRLDRAERVLVDSDIVSVPTPPPLLPLAQPIANIPAPASAAAKLPSHKVDESSP